MIRGTLDEFTLPDIIRLIASGDRSGTLEIRGAEGSGRIQFRNGLVCGAQSDLPHEPLGRKLVRARSVSEEQLWSVLERPSAAPSRLGHALIAAGLVTDDQVAAALGEQTEEDVVNVIRLDPLEFVWTAGDPGESGARLRAEELIDAISDRLREVQSVRDRVPLGAAVTLAASPPEGEAGITVSANDWRILAMLGTRRAVRDLLRYSGAGDVQTLRSINRLISEGLVEITPSESEPEQPRGEFLAARTDVWDTKTRPTDLPPPPPGPAPRIIRLPDDNATPPRSRIAPFEIAIIGATSRVFNSLTESFLREGLRGLPIEITSFGLQELPAAPPDPEVVEIARELGLETSEHRTKRLAEGELRGADLVLGFDRFDLDNAVAIGGAPRERAFTLQEFADWAGRVQAPVNSDLPVRGRVVVARVQRGRSETIGARENSKEIGSLYGSSDRSVATHVRTLCRAVVGVLRGQRRPDPSTPRPPRAPEPPPPPPKRGSYQTG